MSEHMAAKSHSHWIVSRPKNALKRQRLPIDHNLTSEQSEGRAEEVQRADKKVQEAEQQNESADVIP